MANFISSQKQIVAVSITPQIGVEVALLDKKAPVVLKYGKRPVEYNFATREIQDYLEFKSTLIDLFKELDISLKSSIYLVLPNVHLDFESLPLIIGDEAISNAILSKAEDSYIFKRVEPVSAWADLTTNTATDKRFLVYTSFQQTAISQIKEIFLELGATLVGIESSYSAILRGLTFSGAIEREEQEELNWNLLLVNSNSYALFSLAGTRLVDYTEVPLAIKSFSYEEAYQAISTSVSQVLPNFPARKLLIISQAEDICAEVLKTQIVFDEEIVAHDSNKYAKEAPLELSDQVIKQEAIAMTYALIGALAVDHMEEETLSLNLLEKTGATANAYFVINAFEREIPITEEIAKKAFLVLAGIIIAISALIYGIFWLAAMQLDKTSGDYEQKSQLVQQEISAMTSKDGILDIETLITKIIAMNKKTVNFYDSIATDIPNNLWLQYYYNKDGDKVAVEGVSTNIADIYNYYKSLKVISPESSIKLNKLQILSEVNGSEFDLAAPDVGDKFYDFEISNVKSPRSKVKNAPQNQGNQMMPNDPNAPQDVVPPTLAPPPVNNLEPLDIKN